MKDQTVRKVEITVFETVNEIEAVKLYTLPPDSRACVAILGVLYDAVKEHKEATR